MADIFDILSAEEVPILPKPKGKPSTGGGDIFDTLASGASFRDIDPISQAEYESYRSDPSKVLPIIQEAKKMRGTISQQIAKDWRVAAGKATAKEIAKDVSAGPWATIWEQAGTQEANSLRAVLQTAVGLSAGMAAFLAGTVATVANEMKQVVTQGINAAKGRKFSMNWDEVDAWKKAAESFFEYDVTDPTAQIILMSIGAIPTGVKAFFDTLSGISQTEKGKEVIKGIADNLPDIPFMEIPREDIQAAIAASLDATGVLGELAAYGAVFHAAKLPKAPKVARPAGIPKKPLPTKARPLGPRGIEAFFAKERRMKKPTPAKPKDIVEAKKRGIAGEYEAYKPTVLGKKGLKAIAKEFTEHDLKYDGMYETGVHSFTPQKGPLKGDTFSLRDPTVERVRAELKAVKERFDVPDLTPEQIKAIGKGEEITLEVGGGQKIYEVIAKRLIRRTREKKAERRIIEERERKRIYLSENDIAEIKTIAESKRIDGSMVEAMVSFRFRKNLRDLSPEEANLLKLHLIEETAEPILPTFWVIQKDPKIPKSITNRLDRLIKTYDVADIELASYIDLFRTGEKITGTEALRMGEFIKAVHELRPGEGRIVAGYLAPVKRILGEKFVAPFRRAALQIFKAQNPYLATSNKIFRELKGKNKTAISEYREGQLTREQLTPKELRAADVLTTEYNKLWKEFGIDGYIDRYNPRIPRFDEKQDLINWAFSRRGIQDFEFWAKHKRIGELFPRETDAEYLFNAYIRSGFKEKFNSIALEEAKPLIKAMNPERQTFANKWLDTVIKKRPTADEKIADTIVRKLFKKAGVKVKGNERYYKNMVATMMDMNYSAFMGLRPKLGLRNLTQQMLIINEYGLGAYLEGKGRMYSSELRQVMDRSDMLQLRQRQYAVFEEKIGKATEGMSKKARDKMMWFYRWADLNNCKTAFSTGYLKAKNLAPRATQAELMRAGEKAITNTQWGYGLDLPYIFKTPTGKIVSQYMSWPIWYADHLARIVIERQGAKLGRTIAQAAIVYYIADKYGIDYTRTVLLGVMPKALGYTAQSIISIIKLLGAIGTMDMAKIEQAGKRVLKIPLGYTPGYLAVKDIQKAMEGRPEEVFIYKKKGEKKKKTLRTIKVRK